MHMAVHFPDTFLRYIPLCRGKVSSSGSQIAPDSSFPSLSFSDEVLKAASSSLIRCKYGVAEAAAKVCFLKDLTVIVLSIWRF